MCKFGRNPAICLREEAIFVIGAYHVTFDLDLEQNLDARPPADHPMQVWSQSSHFCRSRSDLRKKSLQTDRHTHTRTDDRRHAIVLSHGMSKIGKYCKLNNRIAKKV